MKYFINITIVLLAMATISNIARAESTTLSQSIVPLQCYIDAVNAGNGSHLTIKPEDCQKQVTEESNNEDNSVSINKSNEITEKRLIVFNENQDKSETIIPNERNKELIVNKSNNTLKAFIEDNVKNDYISATIIVGAIITISWAGYSYFALAKLPIRKR